ncbi:MAG: hypothetical protein J6A16_09690 [Oscillospiraceae bacterium]|nr:hypothetical protein [Oscillospiraceae bacterium]
MRLPNDYVEKIFNDLQVAGLSCSEEIKKIAIITSYSVLLEYHQVLREELLKSGIDIGILGRE